MNARALKRRLMKGMMPTFWGRRAFLTVRIPVAVFSDIPSDYPTPATLAPSLQSTAEERGWRENFLGHWSRVMRISELTPEERSELSPAEGDEWVHERWSIYLNSGPDPRVTFQGELPDRHVSFLCSCPVNSGNVISTYTWWEGAYRVETTSEQHTPLTCFKGEEYWISPEIIDQFIARNKWESANFYGHEGPTTSLVDCFLSAGAAAQAVHARPGSNFVYITYSVMSSYRSQKLRFCAAMKKALKVSRKHGHTVTIVKSSNI